MELSLTNSIRAKSMAVGTNPRAVTFVGDNQLATEFQFPRLLLSDFLDHEQLDKQTKEETRNVVQTATTSIQNGDKATAASSIHSIVAIFKSIGDTVSSAQKIVDVA